MEEQENTLAICLTIILLMGIPFLTFIFFAQP